MKFDDKFAERVAKLRNVLGLTQSELASSVGVVQRQIAAYEAGESKPRQGVLLKLADSLGTTIEWLSLGLGEEPNPRKLVPSRTVLQVPIIDISNVAYWIYDHGKNDNIILELHPTSYKVSHLAFGIRVNDDTMAVGNAFGHGFPKGSLVIFDPTIEAEDQDFVLALFEDGPIYFRQIFFDWKNAYLNSLDSRYHTMTATLSAIEEGDIYLIPAVYTEITFDALERVDPLSVPKIEKGS